MKFINSEEDIIGMIELKKQIDQILRNQLYIMSSDYAFRRNDTELMDQSDNAMKAAISATLGMLPNFNQNHTKENNMETENKLTEECVEASIAEEYYTTLGVKTTVCLLTLKNGFEVVGTSACVDASAYSEEIGKPYARKKAFDEAWKVLAYAKQSECCKEGTNPCTSQTPTPTD